MSKFLTLIILAIINISLSAQTINTKSREFIIHFYKERINNTKLLIYKKGIYTSELNNLIKPFQENNIFIKWERVDNKTKILDSIILTKEENKYIIDQLQQQKDTSLWNNLNIPNSFIISQDTLSSIFIDKQKSWIYFYKIYGSGYNDFTMPIFFRNDQYCLFYYGNYCSYLCGEGELAIYKLEKNIYKKWLTIYQWQS